MSLKGKVALVTGARGIGGASAKRLAHLEATVIVTYKQNENAAAQLVADIAAQGGVAHATQVDVLDADAVVRLVDEIHATHGRLDIVVNNAAVAWLEKPFADITWEEMSGVVNNELRAAFALTKAALPLMKEQHFGRLIYMASDLAVRTLPDTIASGTAKAALTSFVRYIASELGPYGITANAIAPGLVLTESSTVYLPADHINAVAARTPLGRVALPADIAGVVSFLAGDEGAFMTGSYLVVDGGRSLLV